MLNTAMGESSRPIFELESPFAHCSGFHIGEPRPPSSPWATPPLALATPLHAPCRLAERARLLAHCLLVLLHPLSPRASTPSPSLLPPSPGELLAFVAVGVACGLLGGLWNELSVRLNRFRFLNVNKFPVRRAVELLLLLLLQSTLTIFLPSLVPPEHRCLASSAQAVACPALIPPRTSFSAHRSARPCPALIPLLTSPSSAPHSPTPPPFHR